jgi:UDP-N-acetylglucosamine acyltransferase
MSIHATAIVDKSADIDPTAEIGAYAIVEHDVHIGAHARLWQHAFVAQGTTLGQGCEVHPFAVVGHAPQDYHFKGEPSYTRVGDETVVREGASIHRGTFPGSTTVVGRGCLIMATGHVGHNCIVGDHVIIANSGLLSGHIEVGDRAFISGNASVHQFVRIGELVMIAGGVRAVRDVPPFMMVGPGGIVGPNVVGLRRAGMSSEERMDVRRCYRALYRTDLQFSAAVRHVAEIARTNAGRRIVEFLGAPSKRGFVSSAHRRNAPDENLLK